MYNTLSIDLSELGYTGDSSKAERREGSYLTNSLEPYYLIGNSEIKL
jgi:hypothetical protein